MTAPASSLWTSLFAGATREEDPAFRAVLTDVLHTSLRQCGAIGLVGTLLYAGLSVFGLGYELHWSYDAFRAAGTGEQIVLMGLLIVAALSTIALVLAQMQCRLRTGRLFGLIAIVLTAAVATFEGALRSSFAAPYIVPMYLVIVAIVPFRPAQVFGIGGVVAAIVYGLGPSGPAWTGTLGVSSGMLNHLTFVAGSTVLITGTSMALYRRHCSFGTSQAALQKNRDRLRRVQSVAQVGGWDYDPETDTATGTDLFYRLLGLPERRSVPMEKGLRAYPPAARTTLRRALNRCVEEGVPFDLELPLDTDGPEERWTHVQGRMQQTEHGTTRLTGTLQDITDRKQREQALQRERDRFETLFQSLPTPVVQAALTDAGARVETVNAAFETEFGVDAEAVPGTDLCSLLAPERDDARLTNTVEQAFLKGGTRLELQRETPDGVRSYEVHFATRQPSEGAPEGYAVFVDVTDREKREEILREREQKTTALYAATEELLRADASDTIADQIQSLVKETFDYPNSSIQLSPNGTPMPSGLSLNGSSPDADPAPTVYTRERLAEICRTGETVVTEDVRPTESDDLGTVALLPIAEHGLVSVGSPAADGIDSFDLRLLEILSAQASAVLDRLDREQALQQSEARFRGVFENAAVGIALLDSKGTIIEANSSLYDMMRAEADLEGRSLRALIHPDALDADQVLLDQLLADSQDCYEVEKRFVRPDGTSFWGTLTVSRQEGTGEAQAVAIIENIDDRKRHKEQLKRAKEKAEEMNQLKSAFLTNMSHEIRTPLTSIIGFAEALDDDADDAPVRDFAQRIKKSGHRLLETLNAVLNLSKLESGSYDLSLGTVNLATEALRAVDHFAPRADDAGVRLKTDVPDDPVWTTADLDALHRIQHNLLSNAFKYTDADGTATVSVYTDGNAAVLAVEDTGIGMDPDQVPQLFRAFQQASTGVRRAYEGSGLGLAVVHRLVEHMDGTIDVETEKGEGTRIEVRLPLADPPPAP